MRSIIEYLLVKDKSLYLIISLIIVLSCNSIDSGIKDNTSYISAIQEWHQERIERLKDKYGILSVIGLYWLKEGDNSFGSDPSNDIVLSEDISPDFIGSFILYDDMVQIKVKPGIEVMYENEVIDEMVLQSDMENEMTILSFETLNWFIIERNGEYGVRFRDSENPRINQLNDIEVFKIDPAWRFDAQYKPYEMAKMVKSVTPTGAIRDYLSEGAFIIEINNHIYQLDPIRLPNSDNYLLIFGDMTNGIETYGGGRFLYIEKTMTDSTIIIDFNKSINPPCAISDFFVCPLPSHQNILPFKVTAGEKKYDEHKHEN
jgi:uncharacterized protein (DUF1684 family)